MNITLRKVEKSDLDIFFTFQLDPESNFMAGFIVKEPSNREAFNNHWQKRLKNQDIINRTILYEGRVVGSVSKYVMDGKNELTYWIGRDYWGKGIASKAVEQFLTEFRERPLYARAVVDNVGSIRVLEKNGFLIVGKGRGYANARKKEVEEFIFKYS